MLRGKNINLRLVKEKDMERFLELDQDIELRGEYFHYNLFTDQSFKKWYSENGLWGDNYGRMLITDKDDNILGYVEYFKTVPYYAGYEIGYLLYDKKSRGKGFTTEAVRLFIDFLFKSKLINRLELKAHVDNIPSQRIAEKCGFTFDCIVRGATFQSDFKQYSLLLNDFHKK